MSFLPNPNILPSVRADSIPCLLPGVGRSVSMEVALAKEVGIFGSSAQQPWGAGRAANGMLAPFFLWASAGPSRSTTSTAPSRLATSNIGARVDPKDTHLGHRTAAWTTRASVVRATIRRAVAPPSWSRASSRAPEHARATGSCSTRRTKRRLDVGRDRVDRADGMDRGLVAARLNAWRRKSLKVSGACARSAPRMERHTLRRCTRGDGRGRCDA